MLACGLLRVDTVLLQRMYVLVTIEIQTRTARILGVTPHTTEASSSGTASCTAASQSPSRRRAVLLVLEARAWTGAAGPVVDQHLWRLESRKTTHNVIGHLDSRYTR
jgi:hypothetical protein